MPGNLHAQRARERGSTFDEKLGSNSSEEDELSWINVRAWMRDISVQVLRYSS